MGYVQELIDSGGFKMDRKNSCPVVAGETPYALRQLGLWNTETGEFDGLFQKPEPVELPAVTLDTLLCNRAKLVNQLYIWPWRGTISDLVALAALCRYDRLDRMTIFHAPDVPKEQYLWFREHNMRTHCCDPMDVIPYVSTPLFSTYCGDIIFEQEKDCTPMPQAWLDGNDWEQLAGSFGGLTRDLAALGFKTIRGAGWWLRLLHTWRFNSKRLLGEISLSCNGLQLHAWNQCPDFYDWWEIAHWVRAYAQNEYSQADLIKQFLLFKDESGLRELKPCKYYGPYVRGTFVVRGSK